MLLGFAVPVLRSKASGGPEAGPGLAEIFEHRFRPISAGVAVPIFAFFSAGVAVGGWEGLGSALTDPVAVGIILALVLGKPIGIMGTTWLLTKATKARLDDSLQVDRRLRRVPPGRHRLHRLAAGRRPELRPRQPAR